MDAYKPSAMLSQDAIRKAPSLTLIAVISILVLAAGYYCLFVRARFVTKYGDLDGNVGRNVTFVGEFKRDAKMYDIIKLNGRSIRFYHSVGSREWSPKSGDLCRVFGMLEYEENYPYGPPFAIRNAEYYAK